MKANELRLGNYVNVPIPEQCPFRIDDFECLSYEFIKVAQKQMINGKEVHPLTWYGNDLQPIPLTEEWLLKFGFENLSLTPKFDGSKCNFTFYWEVDEIVLRENYEDIFITRISYVHQLQNLYFALTGEELNFKSE